MVKAILWVWTRHLMSLVTYFLITIIHKITEAESVQKHWWKLSARFMHNTILGSDGGHFSR